MKPLLSALLVFLLLLAGCQERGQGVPEPSGAPSQSQPEDAAPLPVTARLTVPEGYTLPRIGMALEEMSVCTAEEFVQASQELDVSAYPLLALREESADRCFALEGYLFPDTYEIYTDESPGEILQRMLRNTEEKIGQQLRYEIEQSGYTVDEVLTIASIIEKEAFGPGEMARISSVLHNRLDTQMQIQCDVTISYVRNVINHFAPEPQRFEALYDTYQCPGLPAGAICNPGLDAIKAALNPAETDYFFFVTDNEKTYYYGETWEEHQANIAAAKAVNSRLEAEQGA